MKEKLVDALGTVGVVIWYIFSIVFAFAPLFILHLPFWLDLLLIFVMTTIPIIGDVIRLALYIWALVVVLKGVIDVIAIIFFVLFALYVLTTLLPMVISLLPGRGSDD